MNIKAKNTSLKVILSIQNLHKLFGLGNRSDQISLRSGVDSENRGERYLDNNASYAHKDNNNSQLRSLGFAISWDTADNEKVFFLLCQIDQRILLYLLRYLKFYRVIFMKLYISFCSKILTTVISRFLQTESGTGGITCLRCITIISTACRNKFRQTRCRAFVPLGCGRVEACIQVNVND